MGVTVPVPTGDKHLGVRQLQGLGWASSFKPRGHGQWPDRGHGQWPNREHGQWPENMVSGQTGDTVSGQTSKDTERRLQ